MNEPQLSGKEESVDQILNNTGWSLNELITVVDRQLDIPYDPNNKTGNRIYLEGLAKQLTEHFCKNNDFLAQIHKPEFREELKKRNLEVSKKYKKASNSDRTPMPSIEQLDAINKSSVELTQKSILGQLEYMQAFYELQKYVAKIDAIKDKNLTDLINQK